MNPWISRLFWAVPLTLMGCGISSSIIISGGPALVGSGVAKKETRPVEKISQVELKGTGDLFVSFGDSEKLTVEADDNLVSVIKTDVSNGTLTIRYESGSYQWKNGPKFELQLKSLACIKVQGGGRANVRGGQGDSFELRLKGASSTSLEGNYSQLKADVAGASKATLSGSANAVIAEVSGASVLDAQHLSCQTMTLDCRGASTALLNAVKSITGKAAGASNVKFKGDATTNIEASGASHVGKL